jgi:hypothetical protein
VTQDEIRREVKRFLLEQVEHAIRRRKKRVHMGVFNREDADERWNVYVSVERHDDGR